MNLVVGLGNPGNQYNFTRHNTGFLVLDYYFKKHKLQWNEKPKFGAIWNKEGDTIFIKPQSYYNASGDVVVAYMKYYKILPEDVLAICDNFDLKFGAIRCRATGAAGGNNGLKSIDTALNTSDYPRMRIGTCNDELRSKMGDIDFVLSKFTAEEKEQLPGILNEATQKIDEIIAR